MRLFEGRTILEDLAVIARLKRLGVRGDIVFHREGAALARRDIDEVTGGGAIRLVQLDSLDKIDPKGPQNKILRDHLHELSLVRTNIDFLLRAWDDKNATERGALLGRIAKLMPDVLRGLESVKAPPVLDHLTAEGLNEIVQKHRGLVGDYGNVAAAVRAEAEHLGAQHKVLPRLATTVMAIEKLVEQHVLFCPKPLHGERVYQDWVQSLERTNGEVETTRNRLEKLSSTKLWVAG